MAFFESTPVTLSRKSSTSGLTYEGNISALFGLEKENSDETNLSIVRVCQKVRGSLDDVHLSISLS